MSEPGTNTPEMSTPAADPSPRQLVVLSGKGGTGKTTVVAALAALAEDKVLADCDVDAADLHLLLDPSETRREPFYAGLEARIIADRCSGCGTCADYCRFDAIHVVPSTNGRQVYAVDGLACEGCGLCARVCPSDAVEMMREPQGEWYLADTRRGPLVHARLNIGGENSGKLVTQVRTEALALAQASGLDLVLVDGPPGIGCPVIASVTGADLVLLVTEPTTSGVHDLERVARLVQGFGMDLAICINKTDLNPLMAERIRDFARTEGFPIVGELPYDTAVVRAQVERKSIVEYGGSPVAEEIRHMWEQVEELLQKAKEQDGV